MDRREFLKKCYRIGGYAGIACLGMGAVKDARGWGILPATVGVSGNTSWADWDEVTESGWGDSSNVFIALFEGAIGTNEIGQGGGLSEANRTLTQVNNVAGVSGGYRQLTAASTQRFDWVAAAIDLMIKDQSEWTVIIKFKDWATAGVASDPILVWGTTAFGITVSPAPRMRFVYKTSDVSTTNSIDTLGVYWIAVWRKSGAVKAAYKKTTRPIVEADFAAGNTCESTDDSVYTANFLNGYTFSDTARWATIKAGYIIMAKKALF